jgi:hypothetical protein
LEKELAFTGKLWEKLNNYLSRYRVDGVELIDKPTLRPHITPL